MNRVDLINELESYNTSFAEEQQFVKPFLTLLKHPNAFQRGHLPGHITGSSWIVSPSRTLVLLIHHVKLNKWLQPGGHADGEEDVINVARREAEEETGVKNFLLLNKKVFDLDIHPIPARNNFPAHLHYDVRFLFEASPDDDVSISEETHDVRWVSIDELKTLTLSNKSILRMADKVKTLFGTN